MSYRGGDVYTLEEVAHAAGVPAAVVLALASSGELRALAGTRYFSEPEVIRLVPALRSMAATTIPPRHPRVLFSGERAAVSRRPYTFLASIGAHVLLLAVALWITADAPRSAPRLDDEPVRMVFLTIPGPGGGGGGSGNRGRQRAPKLLSPAGLTATVATPPAVLAKTAAVSETLPPPTPAPVVPQPAPEAPPPPPVPERSVVAPVVTTATDNRDRVGVVEQPALDSTSQGTGTGGRAGGGQGAGNGDGLGSGIGNGSGGGTGGGPYRPGTGIQPPRLLREVKADYTEEARRRGIAGDVTLEIVVKRDGSVGEITVKHGLGLGLDQRAIVAVRQWQFAPARRLGEAVDVIVEVSVEFKLR